MPPTVVETIPAPVASTISTTSQVYCIGFRAMFRRPISNHTGVTRRSAWNAMNTACAGTAAISPTVGMNSSRLGSGRSSNTKAQTSRAWHTSPATRKRIIVAHAVPTYTPANAASASVPATHPAGSPLLTSEMISPVPA